MSASQLRGLFVPAVTPFDSEGELDEAGWTSNARALLAEGVDGLVLAGSTGEAAFLEDAERRRMIELARPLMQVDRWLIAGCGSESTRQTVRRCRDAALAGADAVLVVAPHYYGSAMTRQALEAHYVKVADESPLPVVLYNIPRYMHFAIPADLVAQLAEHDNVIGIKDSSGDAAILDGFLQAQSDSFSVLTGHAGSLERAMESGVRGAILAVAAFAPGITRGAVASWLAGDRQPMLDHKGVIAVLGSEIVAYLGVAGVKAAADEAGFVGGVPRLPLLPLSEENRARVASLVMSATGSTPAAFSEGS